MGISIGTPPIDWGIIIVAEIGVIGTCAAAVLSGWNDSRRQIRAEKMQRQRLIGEHRLNALWEAERIACILADYVLAIDRPELPEQREIVNALAREAKGLDLTQSKLAGFPTVAKRYLQFILLAGQLNKERQKGPLEEEGLTECKRAVAQAFKELIWSIREVEHHFQKFEDLGIPSAALPEDTDKEGTGAVTPMPQSRN